MQTLITSSAATIKQPASYVNQFSTLHKNDVPYFDEGPKIYPQTITTTSGSIDTSMIDAFTQGVEITRQKQYDAGVAKIWSGNPGHTLIKNGFGMENVMFPSSDYRDLDLFDPVLYVKLQLANVHVTSIFSFPIIVSDNAESQNTNMNGVIEPLTIRSIIGFFSIEAPFESHSVRGALSDGNSSPLRGNDRILTVDTIPDFQQKPLNFLDMVNYFELGFFKNETVKLKPFVDQHLIRNILNPTSEQSDMLAALSLMSGSSSENYIRYNQRSACCGWNYDNNSAIGTDSITFGGMTH